jgi:hypothetical protein
MSVLREESHTAHALRVTAERVQQCPSAWRQHTHTHARARALTQTLVYSTRDRGAWRQ